MTKLDQVADAQVETAARAVVANLRTVSAAAAAHASRLAPRGSITVHSPVQSNVWTDGGPPSLYMKQRLEELGGEYESAIAMKSEPFVVRIVVEDQDDGSQHVYYFSRGGKGVSNIGGVSDGRLIGYRGGAPIGRLAAYEAGETAEIVIGGRERTFRILERVRFVPKAVEADRWDGQANLIEADGRKSVRLSSLLEVLGKQDGAGQANDRLRAAEAAARREREQREALLREADMLQQQIEAAARSERELRDERRRRVGAAIELRDQAILDRYQDEIFRLPLDRRLVLTGPPGTGKTTTLIKRIAQKCRFEELSDSDQELVEREGTVDVGKWVMFTPSPALKGYLKEAFGREGVAASDDRVRTWSDSRKRIARDVLNILRSGHRRGFLLSEAPRTLIDGSSKGLIGLFDHFSAWLLREVSARYAEVAKALSAVADKSLEPLARRLKRLLGNGAPDLDALVALVDLRDDVLKAMKGLAEVVEKDRSAHTRKILAERPNLVEHLVTLLKSDTEREEDDEDDDDSTTLDPRDHAAAREAALRALQRAVDDAARAAFDARLSVRGGGRRRILDDLATQMPGADVLRGLGETLVTLRHLRQLAEPHRSLVEGVPQMYHRFRRAALDQRAWFLPGAQQAIEQRRVEASEVDAVMLLMLRHARAFLTRDNKRLLRGVESTRVAILDAIRREYAAQVLVDEATDFSPLELACMSELAHPALRSFFVSGDYMQRVTSCGIQDERDLDWIAADFQKERVSVEYRQSPQLAALADAIAGLRGGVVPPGVPSKDQHDTDIPPLLAEHLEGEALGKWLRDRILEIERDLGGVPPIAIFVDDPAQMRPLVETLRPLLEEYSHDVVDCPDGPVKGTDQQIRVFDVRHVKGFEFEAVFFVGVDRLAQRLPDLFDRHLFVGLTRAATYLGVTCEATLPSLLEPTRNRFATGGWR